MQLHHRIWRNMQIFKSTYTYYWRPDIDYSYIKKLYSSSFLPGGTECVSSAKKTITPPHY